MSDLKKISAITKYVNNYIYPEYFKEMERETGAVISELCGRLHNDEYNTNEKSEMIEEIKELMVKHQKYINEIKKNLDICIDKLQNVKVAETRTFRWGLKGVDFGSDEDAKEFIKDHKLIVNGNEMTNEFVHIEGVPGEDGYTHYCNIEGSGIKFFELVEDLRDRIDWDSNKHERAFDFI